MLVLSLLVLLASPAADGVTAIPGTRLRLGMSEAQLLKLGEFPTAAGERRAGVVARQGESKFFGVPCKTSVLFRDGRLERVTFAATGVAPNALDYVESQLRRSKLWRECTRFEPGNHSCDWLGDVKIHVEIQQDRLTARVEAPARPWEEAVDSSLATASEVSPPAATKTPAPAAAQVTTPTAPRPTAPAATPPLTAPAPTLAPAPESGAPAAERSPEPAITLPETLRLSLPERNPPGEWPRMVSSPKLVYPEAARRASVQGVVWVLTLVDVDGSVQATRIDRGIPELNDAAVTWVSQARFAPCVREGRPCRFWVRVAARFTMY
jgi:TonB family protein